MSTATQQTTALSPVDSINQIVAECNVSSLLSNAADFGNALKLSRGIARLRAALTPAVMADVMALQNSPLGFLTDRGNSKDPSTPKEYPLETVRDCLVEAMLRGLRPVNNEFNIIGGRMYMASNGATRKVREFEGLTDLDVKAELATWNDEKASASVKFSASYKLAGKAFDFERIIPVRVNKGQGYDAVLGKALRKGHAQLLSRLTCTEISEGDAGEAVEATILTPKEQAKTAAAVLKETAKPTPETPATEAAQ